MKKEKTPSDSKTVSTHVVLPNDTNTLGNLMGGKLLHWMDAAAAVCAHRHAERVVVTASVNHVAFNHAIKVGDFVTLEAKVARAFTSSMEIYIDVMVDDHKTNDRKKCQEAIYTFVAVDQYGNTIDVPQLNPETEEEKGRFDDALKRKQLALLLAGKIKPDAATEIKALFE
jgi:acyl-CoA hydrolase